MNEEIIPYDERCGTCKWFKVHQIPERLRKKEETPMGKCHFNPPTVLTTDSGPFYYVRPEVAIHDYCGQHEQKKHE